MKIVMLLSVLLLIGCEGHSYTSYKAAQEAMRVCEPYDGLRLIKTDTPDSKSTVVAICENNLQIKLVGNYKDQK